MKKKIIDSFKEPFENSECRINLLTGGVMTLIPVINLVSLGFLASKLENSIHQQKKAVKWDQNVKKFFIKGFKTFVIMGTYLILPFLFAFLGGLLLTLSEGRVLSLFYFRGQILNTIGTLLMLISLYLLPFAICLFLESGSMKSGFDIKENLERIMLMPKEYTIIYGIMISLLIVSSIIILFLMNWIAGILIGGFIIFYAGLVITKILCKFFPRKSISINLK